MLWWPGSLGLGGAVLAAGVLTDKVQVLYARTPLPAPIMEQRSKTISMRDALEKGAGQGTSGKRRRDEDFAGIDGVAEDTQEEAPPESS